MAIKIKYKDPKPTDFGINDIVINIREGTIFYKSEKGLFKLQGDNLNTKNDLLTLNSSISSSRGFFATPGLGSLKIQGFGIHKFKVGQIATLEVGGHILPSGSASPLYDLGSPNNPWRDLYLSPSSLKFIKTQSGVGASRVGTTFIVGRYKEETMPKEETILTKENVDDLKLGKTLNTTVRDLGEGDTNKSNIVFPNAIMSPVDDSTYQKFTLAGRVGQFVDGTLFFDQNRSGDNNYIALGATDTQIRITGTITASIDGGSF
jgi:hypothetical protein